MQEAMETFGRILEICAGQPELVKEFNRLSGYHMGEPRKPIEAAIDAVCGYDPDKEAFPAFAEFVFRYIFTPLCSGTCGA